MLTGPEKVARNLVNKDDGSSVSAGDGKAPPPPPALQTHLRVLTTDMPEAALAMLDTCTNTVGRADDEDYAIEIDFVYLEDTFWCKYDMYDPSWGKMSADVTELEVHPPWEDEEEKDKKRMDEISLKEDAFPYTTSSNVFAENHVLSLMVKEGRAVLSTRLNKFVQASSTYI